MWGLTVGISSPPLFVQKLFPLPVSWSTFRVPDVGCCRAMSAVPKTRSSMVENVGVAVEVSFVVVIYV
jgi:hypothetical protein